MSTDSHGLDAIEERYGPDALLCGGAGPTRDTMLGDIRALIVEVGRLQDIHAEMAGALAALDEEKAIAEQERDTALAELAQAEAERDRLSRENADWRRLADTLRDIRDRQTARFDAEIRRLLQGGDQSAYRPAKIGHGDVASTWYLHECGQPELWPAATGPEDGGCDRCEAGSPNASDWQPLYVREATPSERPTPKE